MSAYYNENDPKAAAWLRELIAADLIAPGEVDERDIRDVCPQDLDGFIQCHFFAGIGGWSYALRQAGWSDDQPVWTGSCPCQPFSTAGQGKGFDDERHLWPDWFHLISICRPAVLFGEQVASPSGRAWIDLVSFDLESLDYAASAVDLCSAGVGAPHIRQRLYWVAYSASQRWHGCESAAWPSGRPGVENRGAAGELGDTDSERGARHAGASGGKEADAALRGLGDAAQSSSAAGSLGHAHSDQCARRGLQLQPGRQVQAGAEPNRSSEAGPGRPTNGFWSDADWLHCTDGKWRPVEPGAFPLADGVSARVGRLRGYGNAIDPHLAATFIAAAAEVQHR